MERKRTINSDKAWFGIVITSLKGSLDSEKKCVWEGLNGGPWFPDTFTNWLYMAGLSHSH